MGSRNRFGRKKEEGSFNKWRRKRGEEKNRNQLKRETDRVNKLSKIKNPNDWTKNQLSNAKKLKAEAEGPIKKKLAYSAEEKASIEKRRNVRGTPDKDGKPGKSNLPDDVKAKVRAQLAKDKAKAKTPAPKTKTPDAKSTRRPNKEKVKIEKKAPEKKDDWKPTAIQKKLMKGGWTEDELKAKQAKHKQWKDDRKAGKLKTKKFDPRSGRR